MRSNPPKLVASQLTAQLRPVWVGGQAGYRYDVLFEDDVIVSRSLDPQHHLARAFLKRGLRGIVTIIEEITGKPRTLVDVEKAADWFVSEEDRDGLRIRKWCWNQDRSPQTAEMDIARRSSAPGIAA